MLALPRAARRLPLLVMLALMLALGTLTAAAPARTRRWQPDARREVRALWVTRATLNTPPAIAVMVRAAKEAGFNTLFVQVRGRGDAYYRSALEGSPPEISGQAGFDPLGETLTHAHRLGLAVHAWVAVNLVSSAVDLSTSTRHITRRQPDWLMVPRELARELGRMNPRSPAYLARLARWTRAHSDEVEGIYASPIHPWAARHVATVVTELATTYPIDGVHLDYVRFPDDRFDYSRAALQQFKLEIRPTLSAAERARVDSLDRADPLAYPDRFPDRWIRFRQARLTALVARIRTAVKTARPSAILSAAAVPDVEQATARRFQDWPAWLDQRLIDVLCPMIYTQDAALFGQQLVRARALAGDVPVWAGIGAYQLSRADTLARIDAARRLPVAGIALFSYDALVSPPGSIGALAELGRAAFGAGAP